MAAGPSRRIVYADTSLVPFYAEGVVKRRVRLGANQGLRRGTVLAERRAAPGVYWPYDGTRHDGLEIAKLLLETECATDANGLVYLGAMTVEEASAGIALADASAFVAGCFSCEELIGLDARAVLTLGRIIQGTILNGVLSLP